MIERVNQPINIKQRVLGEPNTNQHTIVADTNKELLPENLTAVLGQKIIITNLLATDLFVAYGRVATATNYDIPIPSGGTWVEDNYGLSVINGISSGAGTNAVTVTAFEYIKV